MEQKINTSKEKVEYFKGTDLNKSGFNETVGPMPRRKEVKKNVGQMSEQL